MRTFEVLHSWDALKPFLESGTFFSKLHLWNPHYREPVGEIDLTPLNKETRHPGMLFIPQDEIEEILHESVLSRGRTDFRWGHEVVTLRQFPDGVEVEVARHNGAPYRIRADFLVGCDGARSAVRRSLGLKFEGKTYPTRLLLADFRLTDERADLPWPRICSRRRGGMGAIGMGKNRFRLVATLNRKIPEERQVTPEAIREAVERLFGPGDHDLLWHMVTDIHRRESSRYRMERTILCGDAAHVVSPAGAQGMNSGIHDSHNLAWKLAAILQGGCPERLLSSYEEERREAILQVSFYTDFLNRIELEGPHWLVPILGRWLLRLLRQPTLFRIWARKAGMLDLSYSRSSLLIGQGRKLGHRLDRPLLKDGKQIRLMDLVSPGAALLLFDNGRLFKREIQPMFSRIPELKVYRVVSDPSLAKRGDLIDLSRLLWRCSGKNDCVLLRPDGHIGWMGDYGTESILARRVKAALGF